MDDYYQLARMLQPLDRQGLATELRKFHQQTVDQVLEHVLNILGQAEFETWSIAEIRENVRTVELKGRQFATDRNQLRRCEAILYTLRARKPLILSKKDINDAYERGHGVGVDKINDTALEVALHPGKFEGE